MGFGAHLVSHVQLREVSADFLACLGMEIVLFLHTITVGTDVWREMGKHGEIMRV